MAAMVSHAALAAKWPDGRWASGPLVMSVKTCSTIAWPRWWPSAWISSTGESVKTAWWRQTGNSSPVPLRGVAVLVADPADDQAGGDRLAFPLRRERRVPGLGGFGVGDPAVRLGRVGCPARS
jgi:hypothetical protein